MDDFRTLYWTTMCELVPTHIDWLADARSGNPNAMWLNHSIVAYTAAMTEGAIESVMRTRLFAEHGADIENVLTETDFSKRVVADLDKRIRTATGWETLKKLFRVVTGTTLAEAVGDDSAIAAVGNLFKLRNAATAHGRAINFVRESGTSEFSWESNVLNDVQKYLVGLKVWAGRSEPDFPEPSDFFTDAIADHFYDQSLKMLVQLDAPPTTIHSVPTGRTKTIVDKYRSQR